MPFSHPPLPGTSTFGLFKGRYSLPDCSLLLVGTLYLAYVATRAFVVPATIDEAYSILYYAPRSILRILTYDYPEPSANNHILNTLSIKLWTWLFGQNLGSARLGNLLAAALYVAAGTWLVRQLFTNPWARLAGLVLWLENHYLAEFFSIGRGYGMSIGLMAAAIAAAYRFVDSRRTAHLAATLALAWLAVAANFTLLNFYACLSGILLLLLPWQPGPKNRQQIALFATSHALLAGLMYLPVTRMLAFKEFEKFGVTGFFEDTVQGFIRCFFLGQEFLGNGSFRTAQTVLVVYFALSTALFFGRWLTERRWTPSLMLAALLPGTIAVNIAITLLTDAAWLPARTCTFFYPLLVLSFFTTGSWLVRFRWLRPPLLLLALVSAICFTRVANLRQSYEWWFDRDTVAVLDYLKNVHLQEQRKEPIRFNAYWLFSLSFKFHLQGNQGTYAKYVQSDMEWREIPNPTDEFEFFYAETKDFPQLADRYEIVWVLEPGQRALLRKKNPVNH